MEKTEEHFKIYELAVQMAEATSSRRTSANSFFLTLQGALIAGLGLFIKSEGTFTKSSYGAMLILSLLGIVLCIAWILTIKSYRDLNAAKWGVILEIEKNLPLKPFTNEWRLLETEDYLKWKKEMSGYKKPTRLFKWLKERHKYYTPQSSVERYIPGVLIFGFLTQIVLSINGLL